MWRFLEGAMEPPVKKIKTTSEKRQQHIVYENEKRRRNSQPVWLKTFDWLEYRGVDVRDVPVVSRPSSAIGSAGCDEPRPSTSSQSSAESRPLEAPQTGQVQHRMFCTICKTFKTSGTFVTGSTNFKVESINFHGKSASHRGNWPLLAHRLRRKVSSN